MFDLIKNQWIGIAAIVLVAFAVLGVGGGEEGSLGSSAVTTVSNPWVFSGATVMTSTLAVTGASTFSGDVNYFESTETHTVDDILTIAESGKVNYIGTAGVDLTLPTAATSEGVTYRMVVSANFATTNMTITGGAADATDDLIFGNLEVAGAIILCAAEDTISFVNTAELIGDYVEFHSDGTNWYVSGQAGATGGITCTDVN